MPTPVNYTPTGPGVLSPEQWAEIVARQRIDKALPVSKGSLWGGIQVRPKNVYFTTQNKGEKVFILLRKHWTTNAGWVFNTLLYVLAPLVLIGIASLLRIRIITGIDVKVWGLVLLIYYGYIYTNALRKFVDWYFNLYLVTNERVIHYQFQNLKSRGVSELDLDNIEDVKETSVGFLPSIFNYGDLAVYSAADKGVIEFTSIPQPTFVRDKIDDLADIVKSTRNES